MVALYESDKAVEMGFDNYIKDTIMENLQELEGKSIYVCDLPAEITKEDHQNGSFIIYKGDAMQFIKDFWDEAEETYGDHIFRFGKDESCIPNPFDDPIGYTYFMEDYGVRRLLSNIPFVLDNWHEEVIITPDVIKQIGKELNAKNYLKDDISR